MKSLRNIKILKNSIFLSVILLMFLTSCGNLPTTPTPTTIPDSILRNYFYAGMSSTCANLHSIFDCTKSIQAAIDNKEYEKIIPKFQTAQDAFYFGMNLDCTKYEKFSQDECSKQIDPLIKNKYFDQLKNLKIYPTPNNN